MGIGRRGLTAGALLAGVAAAGVLALPASAGRGGFDLLEHGSLPAEGANIGVGGDGAVVFFVSENTASGTALLRWTPSDDVVVTEALVEGTFSDQISVDSRTVNVFSGGSDQPSPERLYATAIRSAESKFGGPVEPDGASVHVGSSDLPGTDFGAEGSVGASSSPFNLTAPSVSLEVAITRGRVPGKSGDVPVAAEVSDVSVAYAGNLTATDNEDGNQEIFVWTRSAFQEYAGTGGDLSVFMPRQITHTMADEDDDLVGRTIACSTPALNRRGDIAFVSNADITGENPLKVQQLFFWAKGRTQQLTTSTHGGIGTPRWSANGRILVFDATADLTRDNPDESSEIFTWDGHRVRQITAGTTGGSTSPTADQRGGRIAFLTNADLGGTEVPTLVPEVVVTNRQGRHLYQVTTTEDGNLDAEAGTIVTNEFPNITAREDGRLVVTFVSSSDVDGRNSTHGRRIWRTVVPGRLSR
jgi:hypothetical protein